MYHIVYLTTNLVNNKIYVGVRSTWNPHKDSYIGSGLALKLAIKKYGRQSFKRDILFYCVNRIDAFEIETQIVDETFINRKDTYNSSLGGYGGDIAQMKGKTLVELHGEEKAQRLKDYSSLCNKGIPTTRSKEVSARIGKLVSQKLTGKAYQEIHGKEKSEILIQKKIYQGLNNNPFKGKHHTKDMKEFLSKSQQERVGYFKNKRLFIIEVTTPTLNSFTFLYGIYELSDYINISKYIIRNCMKNRTSHKGFYFKKIERL
jgi:hypothetical protein